MTDITLCEKANVTDRRTVIYMNSVVIPNLNKESDSWLSMMDKYPCIAADAKSAIAEIQSAITTWKKRVLAYRLQGVS